MSKMTVSIVLTVLALGPLGAVQAEDMRFIYTRGGNPAYDFQNHTTSTPYVANGSGNRLRIFRGTSGSGALTVYRHGIDLGGRLGASGPALQIREAERINGLQSQVFMVATLPVPTMVPGVRTTVATPAGAIAYEVSIDRAAIAGRTEPLRITDSKGSYDVSVEVACLQDEPDFGAVAAVTVGDNTLGGGQQTSLTVDLSQSAHCAGQDLILSAPRCFKIYDSAGREVLNAKWSASEALRKTFQLKADASCAVPGQTQNLRAETRSLRGGNSRDVAVTWLQTISIPKSSVASPTTTTPKLPSPR
jgi:hypothetical protein